MAQNSPPVNSNHVAIHKAQPDRQQDTSMELFPNRARLRIKSYYTRVTILGGPAVGTESQEKQGVPGQTKGDKFS